ncbi:hypothetical protein GCM10017668_00390 [Streptomyces tuirus]|uniref:Uncharacterized protein n=1 Tax=Streptomyces tuirus TaxID=68278 RepID=A0A7G1N8T1_9ACTN|nr:hypothetical protein GCM10017668_00390 [Streptomyces tuirus]
MENINAQHRLAHPVRTESPPGAQHPVAVGQDGAEQRVAFVDVQRQGAGRSRAGHQGGELLVLSVVDDRVADRPVLRFPDELPGALLGQRGEGRADVRGQIGARR